MNNLNSIYDKIVCISLKEREDKYNYIKTQFEKHNINVEFHRPVINGFNSKIIPALLKENVAHFNKEQYNEFGAAYSFYHVIKTAILENLNNLFIFEDDVVFAKDFDNLVPKYLDSIPINTDGILLYSFMYELFPQNIRVSPRWTKAYKSWSHIAIGMNRNFMEEYIRQQDKYFRIADLVTYQLQESFNFLCASPPLVIPKKELTSDIRKVKNYESTKSILLMGINESNYE